MWDNLFLFATFLGVDGIILIARGTIFCHKYVIREFYPPGTSLQMLQKLQIWRQIFFPYQLIFMKQPKLMNKNEFL